jgi:hypothetical protein
MKASDGLIGCEITLRLCERECANRHCRRKPDGGGGGGGGGKQKHDGDRKTSEGGKILVWIL